jgi:hypothetical protein
MKRSIRLLIISAIFSATSALVPAQAFAADPDFSAFTATLNDYAIGATSTVTLNLTTTRDITSGSALYVAVTDTASTSSSTTMTSTASFASATLSAGSLNSFVSKGSSSEPSQLKLDVGTTIPTGSSYTLTITGLQNPSSAGCHYAAITDGTLPIAATSWTYSDSALGIGVEGSSCVTDTGEETGTMPSFVATATASGSSITLDWDAVTTDSGTANSYGLIYGTDQQEVQTRLTAFGTGDVSGIDVSNITATEYTLSSLTASTTYYFAVIAFASDQTLAYTQTSISATTAAAAAAATSSFTVRQRVITPKKVKGAYRIQKGKTVQYEMIIKNTGTTTLTKIPLETRYSKWSLKFKSSSKKTKNKKNDGIMNWTNVAPKGGLKPGKTVKVKVKYTVVNRSPKASKRKLGHEVRAKGVKTSTSTLRTVKNKIKKVTIR